VTSIEAIINRQFLRWDQRQQTRPLAPVEAAKPLPIVTVSRQSGSRGSYFASRLAQKLEYQRIHREVIDAICESSGYRTRMVSALDNHFRSNLEVMVESVITGQSFDNSDYMRHLVRVLLSMSQLGGVVVVGRAANFILGPRRGFHIRVVCPIGRRIDNLVEYKQMTIDEARARIESTDAERARFVQSVFDADIDDPLRYDLVINAEYIDVEELVATAIEAIKGKMDKLTHLDNDR
jgi:cytidylate kinase